MIHAKRKNMPATMPVRARLNVASKYIARASQMSHEPVGTPEEIFAADVELLNEYSDLSSKANSSPENDD
jgi:hypothetical protein